MLFADKYQGERMKNNLSTLKIAVLATDGFEESELLKPHQALKEAGAHVDIIAPDKKSIKSWKDNNWGIDVSVDKLLPEVDAADYHALILPGGVINPDRLRLSIPAIEFISDFVQEKKLIAAICHGPWTLINARGVLGKKVTSWPSLKMDLINAGAQWVDQEVVIDGNIITSRKPEDIPAFNNAIITYLTAH